VFNIASAPEMKQNHSIIRQRLGATIQNMEFLNV